MDEPLVSVLMPVYNGAAYVAAAVQSILYQTFRDFELVVVDDASTDDSARIVSGLNDSRIRLIRSEQNLGLAGVRNRLLDLCRGKYGAWLDADDMSHPRRLEKQIQAMTARPDLVALGTAVRVIGSRREVWRYPQDAHEVRATMLFEDPLATSSVIMRMDAIRKANLRFSEQFPPAEDYDFWERLSGFGAVANLMDVLAYHRRHAEQSSRSEAGARSQDLAVRRLHERQLERLGIHAGPEEKDLHLSLGLSRYSSDPSYGMVAERWLRYLLERNETNGVYPREAFRRVIGRQWYRLAVSTWRRGLPAYRSYRKSSLSRLLPAGGARHAKVLGLSLLGSLVSTGS